MIARLLGRVVGVLASLTLLFMALVTLVDVVGRNLLGSPLPGATELTELSLVALTFLLYPMIAHRQSHISVDLLDRAMSPPMQRAQQALSGALGALVFAALAWQLWVQGARITSYGDVTAFLRIPLGPVIFFMAVLSGVSAAAFALVAARAFTARPETLNGRATAPSGLE